MNWGSRSHGDTKPRTSCVHPGPSYVRCGTGVSLGWALSVELDSEGGSDASPGMMFSGCH